MKKENENDTIYQIKRNALKYDSIDMARDLLVGKSGISSHREARYKKEFETIEKFLDSFISQNKLALDIGCSGGRYIQLLLKNNFKSVGIDTSMIALKLANSMFGIDAKFINASVTQLPFKENIFDMVFCLELLHHFDDFYLGNIIKDISYLIKPGGFFICDIRNTLNPVMWLTYRKNDGKHFTLKTRSLWKMSFILKKYGFTICQKKSLYFPVSIFAPYIILICKYEPNNNKKII